MRLLAAVLCLAAMARLATAADHADPTMRRVGPGSYRPFYAEKNQKKPLLVHAFWLDVLPVTNEQFLAFVRAHPAWQRGRIAALFADAGYLQHWAAPAELGAKARPTQPVTWVSWFAARAYCKARGARLATMDEWEFAAAASESSADGASGPAWRKRILNWYGKPAGAPLPDVASTPANFWKIQDLHGVIWEWVADFQSALVATEGQNRARFCAAGALSAQDASDYAGFMRFAFRSSLRGNYTTASLGFRCARDTAEGHP